MPNLKEKRSEGMNFPRLSGLSLRKYSAPQPSSCTNVKSVMLKTLMAMMILTTVLEVMGWMAPEN